MTKRRSLVVRIWLDDEGTLGGQVSDPLTDWRRPFQTPAELWSLMASFLAELPPTIAPYLHENIPEADDNTLRK
ncbi:MAG: hypothetical protein GY803_22605 [Chloroflexi bacterium]|nr:hypothetical protein [Chloroflexota bacterium]